MALGQSRVGALERRIAAMEDQAACKALDFDKARYERKAAAICALLKWEGTAIARAPIAYEQAVQIMLDYGIPLGQAEHYLEIGHKAAWQELTWGRHHGH